MTDKKVTKIPVVNLRTGQKFKFDTILPDERIHKVIEVRTITGVTSAIDVICEGSFFRCDTKEMVIIIEEVEQHYDHVKENKPEQLPKNNIGRFIVPSLDKRIEFAEKLAKNMDADMPVSAILAATYWMQAEMINLNPQ